jgi:hypothetical protein
MTRLACSLLLLTGTLYSLHPETPAAPPVVQPVKHRPTPYKVSRSMKRLPLEPAPLASTPHPGTPTWPPSCQVPALC